ncbi:hypothetical protein [Polaribacter tangerinus]|uniref:hypothetical protein n=1 Tax=Polaribacter tangerinus TaxID=1920034 RepID=UPI00117F404C|nr:hypothetical protein [Polaribacter tangerinus]
MRNKNINLFIVIFSVLTIFMSFTESKSTQNLFGYEVNAWLVRGLWLLIGLISYKRYKDKKAEEE